jgi:DNA-binding CsgD family transcriptional regulator
MPLLKRILIGCDNADHLAALLSAMKKVSCFSYNIITASGPADMGGLLGSVHPDLVILCFKNNRTVLHTVNLPGTNAQLPFLCLSSLRDCEPVRPQDNKVVFTFPLSQVRNAGYLNSQINSILRLGDGQPLHQPAQTPSPNLSRYVLELDHKKEVLNKVKDRIAGLFPKVDDPTRGELLSIVNAIKLSANNKELWDDFKRLFEETDPGFLLTLAAKYPFLTPVDLKYCCYLKMNMSNDDIRNIFGISLESVRTHKYRLKKKLALSKNIDLRAYLRSVG